MSQPARIYRINFQSFHETDDIQGYVDIADTDNLIPDDDEPQIIPLVGVAGFPQLSVINNDEDPFTPILAQQLTVQFMSDLNTAMSTFCTGSDQRWSVHYYIGDDTKTIFRGFLQMEDHQEALLPIPNNVTLTANDGIGLLKDTPISNDDESILSGWLSLSEILALCLKKTGLSLELRVAFNIKLVGFIDDISIPNFNNQHLFNNVFLYYTTFEDKINTSINCYDAMALILGEEARLFQMKGQWWVVRVDEIEDATRGLYVTSFDADGLFLANLGEITFEKKIRKELNIKLADAASVARVTRPHKSVRLEYNYDLPIEIPRNIDYSRGDLNATISPTQKHYDLDDWEKLWSDTLTDEIQDTGIYVRRIFSSIDYETERYIVLEAHATHFTFIKSSPIFVHQKDKATVNVSRRYSVDIGGSGFYRDQMFQLRLYGDDGTFWTHDGGTSADPSIGWIACTSTFRTNQQWHVIEGDDADDLTQAKTLFSTDVSEFPVDGTLYLLIYRSSLHGDTVATYYDNIQFTYIPYINGSYTKYTGQFHSTEQTGDYKAKRENQVLMSDSPKKLFKGAMWIFGSYTMLFSGTITFGTSCGNYAKTF